MAVSTVSPTLTLGIPATFSPPTTCFASTVAATYTLAPEGSDNAIDSNRFVLRAFETQCYPSNMNLLGTPANSSATSTTTQTAASYFTAPTCPTGFVSAGGDGTGTSRIVQCCPSGPFTLEAIGFGPYSGCVQKPAAPVTLVNIVTTVLLSEPTNMPYGISYRPIPVVFEGKEIPPTTTSAAASTSSSGSGGGLSTGAKAGIGVGVTLGVIALVLLGVYIWWLQKRKRRARDASAEARGPNAAEVPADSHARHELGNNQILEAASPHTTNGYEKDGPPQELEGDLGKRVEAPVTEKPAELPATKYR